MATNSPSADEVKKLLVDEQRKRGLKGGKRTLALHGTRHFKNISKKGVRARRLAAKQAA